MHYGPCCYSPYPRQEAKLVNLPPCLLLANSLGEWTAQRGKRHTKRHMAAQHTDGISRDHTQQTGHQTRRRQETEAGKRTCLGLRNFKFQLGVTCLTVCRSPSLSLQLCHRMIYHLVGRLCHPCAGFLSSHACPVLRGKWKSEGVGLRQGYRSESLSMILSTASLRALPFR